MVWATQTPAGWIPSWSENGTVASFTLNDITPTLSAAEADATTGDLRDIWFSLCGHTYNYMAGLATADKPVKMTGAQTIAPQTDGSVKYTYAFEFFVGQGDPDVVSEP